VLAQSDEAVEEIAASDEIDLDDPFFRNIARRVAQEANLAIDKATAHYAEPHKYPLPAQPDSMEQVIWQRVQTYSEDGRRRAAISVASRLQAGSWTSRRMTADPGLASVDLRSPVPVADQVDAFPLPEHLQSLAAAVAPASILSPRNQVLAATQARYLALRIQKVKCVDETTGTDLGSDEILLGGTAVDAVGNTRAISPFLVHNDFDDGESKTYNPPRSLTTFDLRPGSHFPKYYHVTLVLSERDHGGTAAFIERLYRLVRDRVMSAVKKAGVAIYEKIANAISLAVDYVIRYLLRLFGDDPFPPRTVYVRIPSLRHRFTGGRTDSLSYRVTFKGNSGHYQLWYDWRFIF
jgi:hypothetical protein